MYDQPTRRKLAQGLTEACLRGPWDAGALTSRCVAALHPEPPWATALGRAVAATERATYLHGRARLEAFIEDWLKQRPTPPEGAIVPSVLVRPPRRRATPAHERIVDHGWPVTHIGTTGELAQRLELSDGQLAWLADVRGLERTAADERLRNYRYRWVPRTGGLPRLIEAPKLRLKEVQRWVLHEILEQVPVHDGAHGFLRGRSVRTHAALHAGQPAVLSLDLRDFFASVTAGRVFGIFRTVGYERSVAHALTGLCTNVVARVAMAGLDAGGGPGGPGGTDAALVFARSRLRRALATPHLPQGAPTSPALANLAALGLDRRLSGLAAASGLTYSRYADDLTFSGPGLTGPGSRSLAELVARIAREEGFALNPRKSRLRTAARRQRVTGIVVNAHPNVAREEYDRLRATLHRLTLDGPAATIATGGGHAGGGRHPDSGVDLRAHLGGRISWVESLNPGRGAKLRRAFDTIDWGSAGG